MAGAVVDEARIALALRLADAAGEAVRPHFRQRFRVDVKADSSPVTVADRAAETAMRALIEQAFPEDGIVGEEFGTVRADADHVWVLDPIDGTRAFIAGRPTFGTLVALLQAGRPVFGVVDQPIARERWLGVAGRPTTLNGVPCETRRCPTLAEAHLATTSAELFDDADRPAFLRLRGLVGGAIYGGDCYNYALLADGHLDLVVESGLKLYDFAALVPVVEGAGGRMCDWEGRPLAAGSDGRVIAAGDPALVEPAVAALTGRDG